MLLGQPTGSTFQTDGRRRTLWQRLVRSASLMLAMLPLAAGADAPGVHFDYVYSFLGGQAFDVNGGGHQPVGRLFRTADGIYYGVTSGLGAGDPDYGGVFTPPTIFKFTPGSHGGLTTLHRFTERGEGGYGFGPEGNGVVQGGDGSFYGATSWGLYRITAAGEYSVLHAFAADGSEGFGESALTVGTDGNLYGATVTTLYSVTPTGVLRVLHVFPGGDDGAGPVGDLVRAKDGNFYGTTCCGGSSGAGTVFRMSLAGEFATLLSFDVAYTGPKSGLIQARDGSFYGTTRGSVNGDGEELTTGTAYQISPTGAVTTLHAFSVATDRWRGFYPLGGLVEANDGNLYGTTRFGGDHNQGTLYRVTPSGTFLLLHSFEGVTGIYPNTSLLRQGNKLYGLAMGGGLRGGGTFFKVDPGIVVAKLTLSPNTYNVVPGGTATFTWTSANASECIASGAWSGNVALAGTMTVPATVVGTYIYTLTCIGSNETSSSSATLKVKP